MATYNRLTSETALIDRLKTLENRVQTVETQGTGTISFVDEVDGVQTIIGELPDGSTGLELFVGDVTPPPVATVPTVSAQAGSFVVTWDGLFVAGAEKPRDFVHVNVIGHKMDGTTTLLSAPVGVLRLPTESVLVTLDVAAAGESWQFSLESEDYNGNKAVGSARTSSYAMMDSISSVDAAWNDLQEEVNSKALIYTQPTVPPIEARLPTTIWNDTSLGDDKVVSKYWSTTTNAWTPLTDKVATEARIIADSKGETIYSDTEPSADKRLPQNVWIDTTGGINIHKRWDGNAWIVAADSRIASTSAAVTAAQADADAAQETADAKSVVYTQPTVPPVEARLPQTIWNDTSLGLDKIVVKYWDGNAWTSLADKAATDAATAAGDAQTSADTAMKAQSYSTNASFDDWTGTHPAGYSSWSAGPVKETTTVRRAPFAARFNVPDATAQYGMTTSGTMMHAPNLEYYTVEVEFYLVSGGLGGSGVILDWNGMTNNRALINFASEVSSPTLGKWYRIVKTLRRPTNATGTWTSMGGYLMGQWSGHGTGAAKNIIFDWFNVRPASTEEILAYSAPADAQTKATQAKNDAIAASLAEIERTSSFVRSYVNPLTSVEGIVTLQGVLPTISDSVSAMGGKALRKTGTGNGWYADSNAKQAFDPTALYRLTARIRVVTPSSVNGGSVYVGVNGYAADGTTYVNQTGADSYSSQHYLISQTFPAAEATSGEWVDFVGYFKGNAVGNSSGGATVLDPKKLHANVRHIEPIVILDYSSGNGTWEVSHISMDIIDVAGHQALVDSKTALDSANGKNKVHYATVPASGTVDTTDGNRPFIEGDTWFQRDTTNPTKIIAQWEFNNGGWVSRKITGAVLTELDAGTISVGYLRGENLSATAIDGKTVTGATVQTEATANRGIKLTSSELAGYDTAGVKNFSLSSGGTLAVRGAIQSGSTIEGATVTGTTGIQTSATALRGVKMSNSGILAYDGSGNLTFKLDSGTGIVELPGLKANSIKGDMVEAGAISVKHLLVSDFSNLIDDAELDGRGWYRKSGAITASNLVTTSGLPGKSWKLDGVGTEVSVATNSYFIVEAGSQFSVSVKAYNTLTGTSPAAYFRLYWYTETGAASTTPYSALTIPVAAWNTYNGTFTAPTDARRAVPVFIHGNNNTGGSWWFGKPVIRRMSGGELIVDGAIDGKVITGPTIQTEATASRGIKLTSAELAGYNSSGVKNFSLSSAGDLSLIGAIKSGSTIEGATVTGTTGIQTSTAAARGVKLTNTGITTYDSSGNMTFKVDGTTGLVEAPGIKVNSIKGDKIESESITVDKLVITSTDNLIVDADFGNATSSWELGTNKTINTTAGRGGLRAFRVTGTTVTQTSTNLVNRVSVGTEDRFRGSMWLKSSTAAPSGKFLLKAKAYTTATAFTDITLASNSAMASATWTNIYGISPTLPSGTIALEFFLEVKNDTTAQITDIDYVSVTRASDGNLIVDGSIDGMEITGATITGGEVKTSGVTGAVVGRMGPTAVQDAVNGTGSRPGIGFTVEGSNTTNSGMFSTDGDNLFLQGGNGGLQAMNYIELSNNSIKTYSYASMDITARGSVNITANGPGAFTGLYVNGFYHQFTGQVMFDDPVNLPSINGVSMDATVKSGVTFTNGWTNFGAGYGQLQVKEIVPGVVLLQGMVKPGTKTDGVAFATIPAEFRPNVIHNIATNIRTTLAAPSQNEAGLLQVHSNGNLHLFANNIASCVYATISVTYYLTSP